MYYNFIIHSPIVEHLIVSIFYLLWMSGSEYGWTCVYGVGCWVLWVYSKDWYNWVICRFIFSILTILHMISIVGRPVCNLTKWTRISFLPSFPPVFVVVYFVDFCHYNWGKMTSQSYFDMHFPSCWGTFFELFLIHHCFSFFENSLFKFQGHFF